MYVVALYISYRHCIVLCIYVLIVLIMLLFCYLYLSVILLLSPLDQLESE